MAHPSRSPSLLERSLLNLPISRKLALMIGVLSLSLLATLILSYFSMDTISAMRAYVGGESLWSKGQKQAIYRLGRYTTFRREDDYQAYLKYLDIIQGDHEARVELDKPAFDRGIA